MHPRRLTQSGATSALGVVTIVAYGVAYYSFSALIDPIRHSTGWSTTALGATFSAVLVIGGIGGLFGGRLVDRLGTRPAFLIAGTIGAGGLAAASLSDSLLVFSVLYALGAGAISALGYYHVTQPAAIRSAPDQPRARRSPPDDLRRVRQPDLPARSQPGSSTNSDGAEHSASRPC